MTAEAAITAYREHGSTASATGNLPLREGGWLRRETAD
jgi:hypothetical protein